MLALPVLYSISRYNYNLFHSLADGVTIVIAACVFTIIWNSRRLVDNNYFLYTGIALLFFAFLDLLHLLGNKNMGVFPAYDNLGPTFYIASRYLLSISLLIAPFFINRRLNTTLMFAGYSLVTSLILLSIFSWKIFPLCIVEGVGLTPFKVISDYVICLILLGAIGLLLSNRRSFDSRVLGIIVSSLILSIATGLTFTLYTDPFGITNATGHFFQIASFYLVYLAFIETSLTKPQEILYRKLKQNEEKLANSVRQLDSTNVELKQEIAERKRAEKELRRHSAAREGINRVLAAALRCQTEKELGVACLEIARELTQSKSGFIGEISEKGLEAIAISDPGWDACAVIDAGGQRVSGGTFRIQGIYGRVLSDGKPLYTNAPAHPDRIGLPAGHPPLESFLGVPLIHEGRTIGMIAVANRPGGYTPVEQETLESLAPAIVEAFMRERAEEALRERTRQLEAANKQLESFNYSISHDLRAPLRAISGFTRILLQSHQELFDEDAQRKFSAISDNARKMGQLIDDLLAFSRSSRQSLSSSLLDMEALIKDVWQEQCTLNPGRKMELRNGSLPEAFGDRALIRQVWINLLANAVKFTKNKDTVLIEVGGISAGKENIYYVKDNGVGFDMKYHDKIFGVFQRLHSESEYEGTGVGLAIVQQTITRHGGRIWGEGKENEGATFYFSLPLPH